MKVHYINILLCALPLNILVSYPHKKPSITTRHTQPNRSLCECELYAPVNYESDPQMKEVMENFNKRTQQRFHEYDDRMQSKRMQCKDKCDKEIQKIILKDKLEKQMEEQLTTLETKIDTNDIPTCICEKSLADKVEKGCLRCGGVLGGGVAPTVGLLGGIGIYGWIKGVPAEAAIAAAKKAGALAGKAAGDAYGMEAVIGALKYIKVDELFSEIYKPFVAKNIYTEVTKLAPDIVKKYNTICERGVNKGAQWKAFEEGVSIRLEDTTEIFQTAEQAVPGYINSALGEIKKVADAEAAKVTADKTPIFTTRNIDAVNTAYASYQTAIIASIVAIVIIILIMVIIYKILRYRRKKKMKKKLQYIKLLEE
ncbi:rifin [Plasmodium reichenowi]|uniref:Rifin n=1 Tax=Plasmodium reichenowi TaxID=5854 RepID=A0A060RMC8_PLARE|nr:rifin [Plasmodium reichenowi]